MRAPLPLLLHPHAPVHEVTDSGCQEAGWPLLDLAALLISASLALSFFRPPLPLPPFSYLPFCPSPFPRPWLPVLQPFLLAWFLLLEPVLLELLQGACGMEL